MQSVAVPGSDDLAEISLVVPSCSLSASSCSTHEMAVDTDLAAIRKCVLCEKTSVHEE